MSLSEVSHDRSSKKMILLLFLLSFLIVTGCVETQRNGRDVLLKNAVDQDSSQVIDSGREMNSLMS